MNNWRKHGEHRAAIARRWLVDPFSSACNFPGWTELDGSPWMWRPPATYDSLPTWQPRTWMQARGWKRAGPISAFDVAGADTWRQTATAEGMMSSR